MSDGLEDRPRLIERAFPLKQASLDSVHEKNVRHGHISTLHIWPARRPLAACRAALIATLLPDPGDSDERRRLLEKIGGHVVPRIEKKKIGGKVRDIEREETVGGILHWGRESSHDLQWFRDEIRKAYGGRAPRVLDPFAGGGAIPLEAMRLGCEVTAIDINPVAWFILKCTLEYPQKFAGQKRPLPDFVLKDRAFMEAFLKAQGFKGAGLRTQLERLVPADTKETNPQEKEPQAAFDLKAHQSLFDADLAWHVRAWGSWVLNRARADLERFYPTIDGKPTVAYLWARTVKCKICRATIPLLKTKWLCKKIGGGPKDENGSVTDKRVLLKVEPNTDKTGPVFSIVTGTEAASQGGNAAQRREYDKKIGAGTMNRAGATCPCCNLPSMTMEDIRFEGKAGRLGAMMTAVVVDGPNGKEYRLPTGGEIRLAAEAEQEIERVFAEIPFGIPNEPTPKGGSGAARAFSVDGYGFDRWSKLFTPRQLLALGTFVKHTRAARGFLDDGSETEAVTAYLAMMLDRLANQCSTVARWNQGGENIEGTFARFALPILWDFAEVNPLGETSGGFPSAFEWVTLAVDHFLAAASACGARQLNASALAGSEIPAADIVVTDPPYYDAIPYSDLMDFFYVWLRRTLHGVSPQIDEAFREPLGPKWNSEERDGELIDDASRFDGDRSVSKQSYEDGMFRAFQACDRVLVPDGRMVVVFASKNPNAWETLVSAIIRAGFVVDANWPIQTERASRTRSLSSAALSSSVWIVCRKRPESARPGWDNRVLAEMRENIDARLREYWDAGIRGPDFVWAATGPALEAYSKHPVVKMANQPGAVMEVSDFLRAVRRIVVDFVVGRVLREKDGDAAVSGLDDVTTYYLLHRHDFGMDDAPAGACILYAISCGLSDHQLADQFEILQRTGGRNEAEEDEAAGEDAGEGEAAEEIEEGSGSKVRLRPWNKRTRKSIGYDSDGRPAPLIDQIHRLMHLWKAGDSVKVDDYLETRGLRRNAVFHQVLQALIELAERGSEERSLLEALSNYVGARGATRDAEPELPGLAKETASEASEPEE